MKSLKKIKSRRHKTSKRSAKRSAKRSKAAVRKSKKSAKRSKRSKAAVRKSKKSAKRSKRSAKRSKRSAKKSKAAVRKSKKNTRAHVRLNQDFVLGHMNKTVLCFQFIKSQNGWKKDRGEKGTHFKICGFTNNEEYDLDLAPPLSRTPKKYIVLHQRGERYPIVIKKNGEILRGGYCFFV